MKQLAAAEISSLAKHLNSCSKVAVVSHQRPDGDALGCVCAACHYLTDCLGKKSVALLPAEVAPSLEFILDGVERCSDASVLDSCDLVWVLDLNGLSRTGCFEQALRECTVPKILVDHHLNPCVDEFNLVFSTAEVSSACELLYWILKELAGGDASKLPAAVLHPLMCGMTTDTNNFANSVWPTTLQMASELLAAGVDRDSIIQNLYNSYRENRVRAISWLLSQKLVLDGGFAYIIISASDRARFDLREGETEGLVNIPLSIADVKMSATFTEDEGFFRVSVRSKKGTSANLFAREYFHGGGHEQAAGGKLLIPEDIGSDQEVEAFVRRAAARFLQNSKPGEIQ